MEELLHLIGVGDLTLESVQNLMVKSGIEITKPSDEGKMRFEDMTPEQLKEALQKAIQAGSIGKVEALLRIRNGNSNAVMICTETGENTRIAMENENYNPAMIAYLRVHVIGLQKGLKNLNGFNNDSLELVW